MWPKIFLTLSAILAISQGGTTFGRHERKAEANPYLMGGEVVADRFYPSLVSVRNSNKHICGGVILNENWILTAAQCVKDRSPSSVSAMIGSNLLESGESYAMSEIKIHEDYDDAHSWRNDIALLRVKEPMRLSWGTLQATLPPRGYSVSYNTKATAVGWGSLKAGGELSNELRSLDLLIGDIDWCNSTYHEFHLNVYSTQACDRGDDGIGTCDGDMGGPLFVSDYVYGIVSWGRPCGIKGYPTIYTKVSEYIDWINGFINKI